MSKESKFSERNSVKELVTGIHMLLHPSSIINDEVACKNIEDSPVLSEDDLSQLKELSHSTLVNLVQALETKHNAAMHFLTKHMGS